MTYSNRKSDKLPSEYEIPDGNNADEIAQKRKIRRRLDDVIEARKLKQSLDYSDDFDDF